MSAGNYVTGIMAGAAFAVAAGLFGASYVHAHQPPAPQPLTPYQAFASRELLAKDKFRQNGFEIIGTQSIGEDHSGPVNYSNRIDCFTLKQVPDNGNRYTGCTDIDVYGDAEGHVKIASLKALLPEIP